jgi:xylitol oxidase
VRNWAGNYEYKSQDVRHPTSVSQVSTELTGIAKVRALGTRHSFNDMADSTTIMDTGHLGEHLELNVDRTEVTVNASMTYGRLSELLAPLGFALHNLASLPHISIGGAISTGTHGSGVANGNLATAVRGIEVATSSGEVGRLVEGDEELAGAVVGLGALGVVTKVSLAIQPAFEIAQVVYDDLPQAVFAENLDDIMGASYSVSGFTKWNGSVEQVWLKDFVADDCLLLPELFGAKAAIEARHPIRGLSAEACTAQLGEPGLWSDRLPHFRLDFTPSAGEEIQSEFFVEWAHAIDALDAIHAIGDRLAEALLISEIRAVQGDELWMSPHYGRDSLALHFTWGPDQGAAEAAAALVGDALSDFDARVHWGKVFAPQHANVSSYERVDDFVALVTRFDPRGAFRNPWFDRIFGPS